MNHLHGEPPDVARRRAIQQIYFDNTLTPAQKHQRILAIQGVHDSDSENMSIFTEGTGVRSPVGSVEGRNRRKSATKSNTSILSSGNNSHHSHHSRRSSKSLHSGSRTSSSSKHPASPRPNIEPQTTSSLNDFDAAPIIGSQRDELLHYMPPPMDDVESVVPNEEGATELKDIPLDDEIKLGHPKVIPSNGSKTQVSDTEPAYDTSSLNSSIDTHEQNKNMMTLVPIMSVQSERSLSYRKKRACAFFFCSLLLFGLLLSPIIYFFRDWFAQAFSPLSGGNKDTGAINEPVEIPETSMPTSSPTKEYFYDPPTAKDCLDIANGNMKMKELWVLRRFQVPMDVNLLYETSDVDTMTDMLVTRLQSEVAPVLAGCTEVVGDSFLRRRLDTTRFVVGNAIISGWHDSDDVCAAQKSTCYRVMVEMALYVRGSKTNKSLQLIVTDALDSGEEPLVSQLGLPSPFDDIKVRGVFPTFSTEAPTNRPTPPPTFPLTLAPTTAPVASPTANPTVQASAQPTVAPTRGPTNPPTQLPTKEPVDCKATLQYVLQTRGVAQINQNAFAWMNVDQWKCNGVETSILDRYALATLYLSVRGDSWSRKQQWMSAKSVCEWQGVGCDANSIVVTSLQLDSNQLSGGLPSELALLTRLTSLELDNNSLSSSISSDLGNLVLLQTLNLANNALTGQLPDTFGNLINLKSLKVDSNQMRGGLTTQIGQMSSLLELSLSSNQLSGNIPTEIGWLSVLSTLNLSTNQFTSIPTEIAQLVSLKSLEISSNKLKGAIPDLQGMTQLTLLSLDNNKLSGNLPSMPTSLTSCNLTQNKFKNKNNSGVCVVK